MLGGAVPGLSGGFAGGLCQQLRDEISKLVWVERIFDVAALAMFTSVIAHGLTGHPAAEWMARHSEADRAREEITEHDRGEPLEWAPAPG